MLDLLLHVDRHLQEIVQQYGGWTYVVLFVIVFCETGLVVTPFLPGDSLLFAAGAIVAQGDGALSIWLMGGLLILAAILGDTVNYHLGKYFGPKVLSGKSSRWLNQSHLEKTHAYFAKYGGKTIILARFIPIVRTFAPFVAGVGTMSYGKFLAYNVIGANIWVTVCLGAGFWFGEHPWVQGNFTLIALGIVFVSVLPAAVELGVSWLAARRKAKEAPQV
jgi:membrane-associated protein